MISRSCASTKRRCVSDCGIIVEMALATELMRFFHIDASADTAPRRMRTIHDFAKSQDGWYENLDVVEVCQICSRLEREGYLVRGGSDYPHPILGQSFWAPYFDEKRAEYGEYDFAAHGFHLIRECFADAVKPVVIEKADGRIDIGTCFLVGNRSTLITARHVIEKATSVQITGVDGDPLHLVGSRVPKDDTLDVAMLVVDKQKMDGLPFLRFTESKVLDDVLCMGYPPIAGFETLQTGDIASINARIKASVGGIVGRNEAYIDRQEYILINARVKGGNSGGPIINKRGYAVGILVAAPVDSQERERIDALGYGLAVPREALSPLWGESSLMTDLPFTNLGAGQGFSTLVP
jgi:serine protease Do